MDERSIMMPLLCTVGTGKMLLKTAAAGGMHTSGQWAGGICAVTCALASALVCASPAEFKLTGHRDWQVSLGQVPVPEC